ncbi:MAG TPA: TRAP transporter large permease subunit, partial [Gammaproteobacteria bacterium]|nr:TRAP transporter large permease subunit [Gammaproteobacteria bacterium]
MSERSGSAAPLPFPPLRYVSRPLAQAAALLIVVIVILITVDVVSRSLFEAPIRGVTELVSLFIPAIVFLALGQLFVDDNLIRSEVLLRLLERRSAAAAQSLQCLFHIVGGLIGLGIALPTAAALIEAFRTGEFLGVEGDFTVPVWPAKLVVVLGSLLLAILCLQAAWRSASSRARSAETILRRNGLVFVAILAGVAALTGGVALSGGDRTAIGCAAIILMFVFVYAGMPVAFALTSAATFGISLIKGDARIAIDTLALVADGAVSNYVFAAVPLFVLMGLVVGAADIGRDSLQAAHWLLRRLKGGLGVATVAANAVFAAITGISVASAAIFSRVAVPPLIEHGFTPRFSVGLVAGSSVLGMLI